LIEEKNKYEAAALIIQRFFRKKKQAELQKIARRAKMVNYHLGKIKS